MEWQKLELKEFKFIPKDGKHTLVAKITEDRIRADILYWDITWDVDSEAGWRTVDNTNEFLYEDNITARFTHYCLLNQPEHIKREDLDCCTRVEDLDDLLDDFHIEFCHGGDPYKSISHYNKSCDLLMKLIQESKMRCSEHCRNVVREAK